MAAGTIYVPVAGDGEAPQSYTVPGAAILDLEAVTAYFDGTGAGTDWLPAVRIYDSSGHLMAQTVGETVAAGDGAQVTFAPFLNQPTTETPAATGVAHASMWFDTNVFGDSFVSIPNNTATAVSFANTYASDPALFSFQSVANPNDTLSLDSAAHLYLISGVGLWNLAAFAQQVALSTNAPTVSGGQLFGPISFNNVHPADYFTIAQPIAGVVQGTLDYMLVLPQAAPYTVTLQAFQKSGVAKDLRRGVIAAVAFPLA
jgi:hypothetical protein